MCVLWDTTFLLLFFGERALGIGVGPAMYASRAVCITHFSFFYHLVIKDATRRIFWKPRGCGMCKISTT